MTTASFIAAGNTQVVTATTTPTAVIFTGCNTNTFRIVTNVAATSPFTFVSVVQGNTAPDFNHPGLTTGSGTGVPITNASATYVTGNFGLGGGPGNVTVATMTSSGAALVFITPVNTLGPGIR
jgi:hypothetical protein